MPPFRPDSIRPTAARSRVGTSVIAASGRPASRRPCARQSWIARQERKLSEPPRRITALPDLRHSTPASAVDIGAALEDHADDAERHAHALDGHAVRPLPAFGDRADGIGNAAHVGDALRHRLDARLRQRQPVEKGGRSRRRPSPRRHPRHWPRESSPHRRGSPAQWLRVPGPSAPAGASASTPRSGAGSLDQFGHQGGRSAEPSMAFRAVVMVIFMGVRPWLKAFS